MQLESKQYSTTKALFMSSAVWFVFGALLGLTAATRMAAPDLLPNVAWLVFSRLRPMHTNTMIFGFVGSALIGAAFYMVPTLLRTALFSEKMGRWTVLVWNVTI